MVPVRRRPRRRAGERFLEPLRGFGSPLIDLLTRKSWLEHQSMFDGVVSSTSTDLVAADLRTSDPSATFFLHVDDEELLRALSSVAGRLLDAAHQQSAARFGDEQDDARWRHPFPIRGDLQIRHLFIQMQDAFAVAFTNLAARTSAVAVGAVRFLAEGYVLLSWLTEPTHEVERRKRAYTGHGAIRARRGSLDPTRGVLAALAYMRN